MNSLHLSCLCLLVGSCQQEFSYKMCLCAKDCPHGPLAISSPLSLLFCSFFRQNSDPVLVPSCFICIDRRWPFSQFSAPVPMSMGQRTTRGQYWQCLATKEEGLWLGIGFILEEFIQRLLWAGTRNTRGRSSQPAFVV